MLSAIFTLFECVLKTFSLDGANIAGAAAVSTPTESPSFAYFEITTANAPDDAGAYQCVGTFGTTGSTTSTSATIAVRGQLAFLPLLVETC